MRCNETTKVIYPTRHDAWNAITAMRKTHRKVTYAYQCNHCQQWHITSRKHRETRGNAA